MPKDSIVKGSTSVLDEIFIQDSSKTTGVGLTGLTSSSSGLVCYRARADDGNAGGTAISLTSTGTLGTWASGWFKEKDATNLPGWYEVGYTNASLASGSRFVGLMFWGATNMAPVPIQIKLTGTDDQDATRGGMTALPNTACTTNASLLTSGTGTDQLHVSNGKVAEVVLADTLTTYTGNTPQTGDAFARLGPPAGASTAADIAAINAKTTNLPGSPAAVGSKMDLQDAPNATAITAIQSGLPTAGQATAILTGQTTIASNLGLLATAANLTNLSNRMGAPAGASISADIAAVAASAGTAATQAGNAFAAASSAADATTDIGTTTNAIKDKTDQLQFDESNNVYTNVRVGGGGGGGSGPSFTIENSIFEISNT